MVLSPFPILSQKDNINPDEFLQHNKDFNSENDDDCSCLHAREISKFNTTIRFVLTSRQLLYSSYTPTR